MSSSADAAEVSWSIHPTNNPQVANFTITLPSNTTVTVDFGTDTTYRRSTAPVRRPQAAGG